MTRHQIKEFRRIQLIEATIDTVARKGFAGLTLADVADAAKLSRGIVNFYFRSKEELLAETLRYMTQEYGKAWREATAHAASDPVTRLRVMIDGDFGPQTGSRKHVAVWYAFWGEARWRPEYLRICQEVSTLYFVETRSLVEAIANAGGYGRLDTGLIARGLNAMIDGLWLDLLIEPKDVDRDLAKRCCYQFLAAHFPHEFAAFAQTAGATAAA
jgi:TetR/AcrR family transcriptional regulator, transcriptional repressor of bet genes